MAVTGTVKELYEYRGFQEGTDGSRTLRRAWQIEVPWDTLTETERDEIEAHLEPLVPVARYDAHPAEPTALARSLTIATRSLGLFVAEVTYNTFTQAARGSISGLPTGSEGNPAKPDRQQDRSTPANLRLPEINYGRNKIGKPLEKDAGNGAPVQNTAGDPYDPAIEVGRSKYTINVKWWAAVDGFDLEHFMSYADSVNSDTISILGIEYAPKTLRVDDIKPTPVWDIVEHESTKIISLVWELNAVIEHDPDTHQIEILSAGKRYRKDGAGELLAVLDRTGSPVADPVPLAANGDVLPAAGEKVYQLWNGYISLPLADLFTPPVPGP